MSEATIWIGRLAPVAVACAILLVGLVSFGSPRSPGWMAFAKVSAEFDRKLRFLRAQVRGSQVVAGQVITVVLCLLIGSLVSGGWPALLIVPALLAGPRAWIDARTSNRVARLEEQIEPWLNAIANALKASASLGEALSASIALVQAPMSEEVDVVVKEYELGTPLDRALENFAERMGSETLSGTVLALKIARKSGGNLPEMLENAASALRELARLEGVVRTKTAEGRAQAFFVAATPIPMVGLFYMIDPHFFEPLAKNFIGHLVIAAAVALWLLAIVAARKIMAVDV